MSAPTPLPLPDRAPFTFPHRRAGIGAAADPVTRGARSGAVVLCPESRASRTIIRKTNAEAPALVLPVRRYSHATHGQVDGARSHVAAARFRDRTGGAVRDPGLNSSFHGEG